MENIDYNKCTILRCFKKDDHSVSVDIPIAGQTSSSERTAVLKLADVLAKQSLWFDRPLTKYDYYIILRKDGDIIGGTGWVDSDSIPHAHAGGDRNSNHICYFDENYNLQRTINIKDLLKKEEASV